MTTQELETLKAMLEKFASLDYFGIAEFEYSKQVKDVIDLVDGAIINLTDWNQDTL